MNILNKQLTSVISKHNQTIKDYEERINKMGEAKVDASEVNKCNEQIKIKEVDIARLKGEIIMGKRNSEELRHKLLSEKETLCK